MSLLARTGRGKTLAPPPSVYTMYYGKYPYTRLSCMTSHTQQPNSSTRTTAAEVPLSPEEASGGTNAPISANTPLQSPSFYNDTGLPQTTPLLALTRLHTNLTPHLQNTRE